MLIVLIACFLGGGLLALWFANLKIPSFDNFTERVVTKSTKIYDKTGKILLYDIHNNIKRQVVPLTEISKNIQSATIAIEDDRFYQHNGVMISSILRAFIANLGAGGVRQGGSTITQQLVKNSLLTQDRSWARKIKELILSLKLEQVMGKDEILAHYLNEIPYGGSIYGVEEASETFFGKPASEATLAEAAYLAAIPKAPTYYSPYGSHRADLDKRKNVVINRMAELSLITKVEQEQALAEKVTFLTTNEQGIKAPHFVLWVRDYLEEKYGKEALDSRGLKVTTTLDFPLQQKAEEIVKQYAEENLAKFNAKNASLVAIDPKTGQVLVMVGSKDYFNTKDEGNFNIALAHRQPGSAFKPFAYAEAFNKGYTPETMLFDLETQFDTTCNQTGGDCYKPKNYDDKFRGPMSMREALGQSINIPSLKVLYLAGLKDTLNLAKNMGIESLTTASQYGLTLVLGGGEVSPLDMTSAYGVFANDGIRNPYTAILKVEDDAGNILEEFTPKPREVLPANTARLISDILSDNVARVPAYGANSPLYFSDRPVAAKTGTTNDSKDAWIVGYTPNIAVGAWAGNNDNSPMEKKVAGLIVAPLWHAFMAEAFKVIPVETFTKPEPLNTELPPVMRGFWQGGKSYLVDKVSGKLATEYTPPETQEERVLTQVHSILYWLDRQDDPQFDLWEGPVRRWLATQNIREQTDTDLPQATDDVHLADYKPNLVLLAPDLKKSYPANSLIKISASYSGRFPLGQVDYFLNSAYLGSVKQPPVEFSFVPADVDNLKTDNLLRLIVRDSVGNKNEIETHLLLNNIE
ncbi:MAG: PBP1A family penicillin-binding protein [Patescibacteria group bacterium]